MTSLTTKETDKAIKSSSKSLPKSESPQVRYNSQGKKLCIKCRALAMRDDSPYCFYHDPKVPSNVKDLARAKAVQGSKDRTLKLSKVVKSARTPEDLHNILDTFIKDLTTGRISTPISAETLIRAVKLQKEVIKTAVTDKRLAKLEDETEGKGYKGRGR